MQHAIEAHRLGKRYRITAPLLHPRTLRDSLVQAVTAPFRNLRRVRSLSSFAGPEGDDVVWAIRDLSFHVPHGEALGIIGRNGAGKSTLLKILSRITEPSAGRASIYGRVGSLLEVGTGFHPDLTGRDNIFLNGSILGMDRRYINRRLDEIVEFAGIAPFIDTPVKRYSSGMYLRLAFAVAAHLEPDVLIVDEILAVGDAEFQRKCMGRMDSVAREGRTILFVSHNMNAIRRLCPHAIMMERGRLVAEGRTAEVVDHYLATAVAYVPPTQWIDLSQAVRSGSGTARFAAFEYTSLNKATGFRPYPYGPLEIRLAITARSAHPRANVAVVLSDQYGTKLVNADADTVGLNINVPAGTSTWLLRIQQLFLKPGTYVLGLWLGDSVRVPLDVLESAARIDVADLQGPVIGIRDDPHEDGVVTCTFDVRRVDDCGGPRWLS